MAASRFMRALETRIVEGHNFATVDLFDEDHARKVLVKFGQAFGKLPAQSSRWTDEEQEFVVQVAAGLAQDGQVVCVRLALFAEMVKGKPWRIDTLDDVGGTAGIGVNFLEDTFSSRNANPEHRLHQQATRNVLRSLLPQAGNDIKGHMRSHEELLEASGYKNSAADFRDLLRILDGELRLITPTDPDGFQSETSSDAGSKYYQLTHDYLVPSLREWLTQKQRETKRGRAELRLEERAELWNAKPEYRHLPSWWETARILTLTDKKKWTEPQRRMMQKAGRIHGLRTLLLLMLFVGIGYGGMRIRRSIVASTETTRAQELVDSLQKADITQVPSIVSTLDGLREWADPLLKVRNEEAANGSPEKLRLSLALLPVDSAQVEYLSQQLPICSLDEFPVVRDALLPHKDKLSEDLWVSVRDEAGAPAQRFQSAAALATFSPNDERWTEIVPFVTQYLTGSIPSVSVDDWIRLYDPAHQQLTDALAAVHSDRDRPLRNRETAALAVAQYWSDRPENLVDTIIMSDEIEEFSPLLEALKRHASGVEQRLLTEMNAEMPAELDKHNDQLSDEDEQLRDAHWKRQALAAVTLVHLGKEEGVWPLIKLSPDPSLRSFIILYLGKLGTNHNTLAAQLELEEDVSIHRALIQSLGGLDVSQIPNSDRERIAEQLKTLFVNDPDSGVHSSASWTLRKWGVVLPDLPVGEPTLTEEQQERIAKLTEEVEAIRLRIEIAEKEFPLRQAIWEQKLKEESAHFPLSITEGLVAHFRFDETDGTTANNAVSAQPSGEYVGTSHPKRVPGVSGNAIYLDGSNGHLNCGNQFAPEHNSKLSFSCWFYTNETERKRVVLCSKHDNTLRRGITIFLDLINDSITCQWSHYYPDNWIEVNADIDGIQDQWHHLAVTYDGSSAGTGFALYLDGKSLPTRVTADSLSESVANKKPLLLGCREQRNFFDGAMDDVRIYNRMLHKEEVQRLFINGIFSIASVPADKRIAAQKDLLTQKYLPIDEPLIRLRSELLIKELALDTSAWEGVRRWYVNGQGQTMSVIPNPATKGYSRINHSFAISSHEVTVAEYCRFRKTHNVRGFFTQSEDCPVHDVTWFDAAAYCNWLSKNEKIPPEEWAYEPNEQGQYKNGMKIREDISTLSGYRLPTQLEWDYACRGKTSCSYFFGEATELLLNYSWHISNAKTQTHPVELLLPNDHGLFDVHGNVGETLHDIAMLSKSVVTTSNGAFVKGGSYTSQPIHAATDRLLHVRTGSSGSYIGLRLVKTHPPPNR